MPKSAAVRPPSRGASICAQLAIAGALIAATLVAFASPAAASHCTQASQCYGVVASNVSHPSGFRGGKVTLRTNCMIVPSLEDYSIRQYLQAKLSSFTRFHLQIGIIVGYIPGGYLPNPTRYFSENKPTGYFIWPFGVQSTNTGLTVTIWAPPGSTNDWELWFDNQISHQVSIDNFSAPARNLVTGTMLTDNASHQTRTYGSSSRLYYYNLGGAITPRWQGSVDSDVFASPGMFAEWADTFWWARMGRSSC